MTVDEEFLDMFSAQAGEYARYRPTYPLELFDWIASAAPATRLVWDCATGSGQAALLLAERFDRVLASDASASQLEHAPDHEGIEYRVATAESSGIATGTVDAVTVATALHWFRLDDFIDEVRRVLRVDGLLTFWTYGWSETDETVEEVTRRYASEVVGDYWADEVETAWRGYDDLEVDMEELDVPKFEVTARWTPDELLGYLRTWSASASFAASEGVDPTELIASEMADAFGDRSHVDVRWALSLRAFRHTAE